MQSTINRFYTSFAEKGRGRFCSTLKETEKKWLNVNIQNSNRTVEEKKKRSSTGFGTAGYQGFDCKKPLEESTHRQKQPQTKGAAGLDTLAEGVHAHACRRSSCLLPYFPCRPEVETSFFTTPLVSCKLGKKKICGGEEKQKKKKPKRRVVPQLVTSVAYVPTCAMSGRRPLLPPD